jgi:NAD(P)H dehydrogenase (quinone)
MSKYLITGATGGLGMQVVEFLLQRIPAEKIVASPVTRRSYRHSRKSTSKSARETILTGTPFFEGVERLLLVSTLACTDAACERDCSSEAGRRAPCDLHSDPTG